MSARVRLGRQKIEIATDKESRAFFAALIKGVATQSDIPTLDQMRLAGREFTQTDIARPTSREVQRKDIRIGSCEASWFWPKVVERPFTVLYLHGGGYCVGSVDASAGVAAALCETLSAPVLALGYRQAPEWPLPTAFADAWEGYLWLRNQRHLGIVTIGDSAGGHLALSTAAKARLNEMPALGAVACSAWFDLSMSGASWSGNRGQDIVTHHLGNMFAANALDGMKGVPPDVILTDRQLSALPPTLLQVGSVELALDDSIDVYERALDLGADVTLAIFEAMPHNFMKFRSNAGTRAFKLIAKWCDHLPMPPSFS